jgi:hypothetical protein
MEDSLIKDSMWIGFDFKQAEIYMLCLFSQDTILKEALSYQDFHKYVASILESIPIDFVTEEQRNLAKTISFGLIYSGFNIEVAKAIILKKRRDLSEDRIIEALEKYQETFFSLFNWVKKAVLDWREAEGYITYFRGAKKFISVPSYLPLDSSPDKLLNTKQGRLCINTYGQNSIGLLLKHIYSNMFRDDIIRENTWEHIPIFDSMNMLCKVKYLDYIIRTINIYATPIIEHNGFQIQMAIDWKVSDKSWGDMKKIKYENQNKDTLLYIW